MSLCHVCLFLRLPISTLFLFLLHRHCNCSCIRQCLEWQWGSHYIKIELHWHGRPTAFILLLLFLLSLSISLSLSVPSPVFLSSPFLSVRTRSVYLSSTLSLSLCPMLLFPLFSFSLHSTRYVRYPAWYATIGVCFVFYREHSEHIYTHIVEYIVRRLKSRDRKIRLRKTVDFLDRGNVLRVVGKNTKEMAKLSVMLRWRTRYLFDDERFANMHDNKDDMETTFQ